jgi:hypothetical protein
MTPDPGLVERVRRELESVPKIPCAACQAADDEIICAAPDSDYQALAEKVAEWVEGLTDALETIQASRADEDTIDRALAALPWRKAVTP